jgi:CubicO group peptidase (beta-lactamase class C family)
VTEVLPVPAVLPLVGGKLSALAREHRVPGAQLAIHHAGRTVAVEFGEAEHGTRRRLTRDTAVPVGSVTKVFTATTAMVLVADGDLELDAPLADHLPELGELGERLTLRQLLSHTAGLPTGPDSEDVATASVRRYLRDHCRAADLVLPPGTGFSYSNLGYVLTGHLIETITGMDWWSALESILLRPLGIEPAAIVGPGCATERAVAAGHSVNAGAGRIRPVRPSLAAAEAAAGALAVSATDLVALGRLHLDGAGAGPLPAGHAGRMREPVPAAQPFGLADGWGLGLAVFDADGTRWVGHDGNSDGTACYLRVDPDAGWVIALTSNANTGAALWRSLLAELAGTDLPISPPLVPAPPTRVAPPPPGCAGRYRNGGMSYVVEARGGGLYLSIDGDAFARLTCHENLVFSVRDPASGRQVLGGRFVRDPRTGAVRAIQLDGRLAARHAYPLREDIRARIA